MPQTEQRIQMYLLEQARAVESQSGDLPIQPKPLRLLAYLALNWHCPHRREELQALFWPETAAPTRPSSSSSGLRERLYTDSGLTKRACLTCGASVSFSISTT
jgi:DNA-binding SARP family transcriptional activator